MKRPKVHSDMDLFRKTIDEAASMGITDILLNVAIGEPLLDPRFIEKALYISRYPQFTSIGFHTTPTPARCAATTFISTQQGRVSDLNP